MDTQYLVDTVRPMTTTHLLFIASLFVCTAAGASDPEPLSEKDVAFLKNVDSEYQDYNSDVGKLIDKLSQKTKVVLGMSRTREGDDLRYHLRQVLVGPLFAIKNLGNQIYVISGCRAHSCTERGWIWIDAGKLKAVSAIVHYSFGDSEPI